MSQSEKISSCRIHILFRICESYNYFQKLCNINQVKSLDLYKNQQIKFLNKTLQSYFCKIQIEISCIKIPNEKLIIFSEESGIDFQLKINILFIKTLIRGYGSKQFSL